MAECCIYPFKTIEINSDGNVYGCSGGRALSYSFGNIFEKPFDEIWNGERAQEFRRQFIEKDYKYCNFEKCTQKKCAEFSASEKNLPYPARVQLHINDAMPDDIEKYIMSALKNAKLINLNTQGEFFENEAAEKLVKEIIKTYPDIKFAVCTKGAYDIEQGLKKFGILDKTAHIIINPSAADDKLIKNVKYAAGLKQEGKINDCALQLEKDILNNEIKEKIEASGIKIQYKKDAGAEKVCLCPFNSIEIQKSGDIYTCCPDFIKGYKIGNINENSLEEIWYGKRAEELRRKMRSGDFSMCDTELCIKRSCAESSILPEKCAMPKYITLAYDRGCNLNCITCRDEKYKNTQEENELYNNKIKELIPVLKDAECILISEVGEAFFSAHSRKLIKEICAVSDRAVWRLNTNGLLFTSSECKALGIYGRIQHLTISLPALDRDIYNKIMRGSDYDIVMKNIKEAVYEYHQNKSIKLLHINSVISSLNYTQMPLLAEFAQKNNVYMTLTQFCKREGISFGSDYKSVSVWDKEHPEFESFKKILKHPALNYAKLIMTPRFREIREME